MAFPYSSIILRNGIFQLLGLLSQQSISHYTPAYPHTHILLDKLEYNWLVETLVLTQTHTLWREVHLCLPAKLDNTALLLTCCLTEIPCITELNQWGLRYFLSGLLRVLANGFQTNFWTDWSFSQLVSLGVYQNIMKSTPSETYMFFSPVLSDSRWQITTSLVMQSYKVQL